MNTLLIVLLVAAGVIIFLLIMALFMRKEYNIHREIIINASKQKVFDYVKLLKNQDNFNKWVMVDPGMKREFKGTDGMPGFVYSWNGNKRAGEGEQEIKKIVDGKSIETEIRFIRPFPGIALANMMMESVSDHQTKVTWNNASSMKFPMNLMLSMIEKMLARDMDTSLTNLKNILEKNEN